MKFEIFVSCVMLQVRTDIFFDPKGNSGIRKIDTRVCAILIIIIFVSRSNNL